MLSVIVPVFQVEQYLEQAINCLLKQNTDDMEIILIDDGSTDKSGEICDCFSAQYTFIKVLHQKNSGVSSARNKGLKIAKGEYVAFLDPDDFIDEGYYSKMLACLEKNGSDIVFSKYKRFYENGYAEKIDEPGFERLNSEHKNLSIFFDGILSDNSNRLMGFVWRSIFKKDIIEKNNILFNEDIAFSEDLIFLLNYLNCADKSCTVDDYGYNYRVRGSSATAVSYKNDLYDNRKHCLEEFEKVIGANNFLDIATKKTLINRIKYISAKEIVYNEMRFNKNAISRIKAYYKNGLNELFLDDDAINQAKNDNAGITTVIILELAKGRHLSLLKMLYKVKYRNRSKSWVF